MHFSIDFLRTFIKVSEERNFSLAAKKLHKTQSSVSTQIALLEEQFGMKLFERSPRPLRLTQAGVLALNFAKDVIHRSEELSKSFEELKEGIAGEVRIGTIASIATYILPAIVRDILEKYKDIRVTISTEHVRHLYESVRRGEIDLAIVLSDQEPSGLSAQFLRTESLCFVVAPDHELSRTKLVALGRLRSTAFIMGPKSGGYTEMLDRMLRKAGLPECDVVARITTFEGMKEITRAGLGISVLPAYTIIRELRNRTLAAIRIRGIELQANIYLVENTRQINSPTNKTTRKIIVEHMSRVST